MSAAQDERIRLVPPERTEPIRNAAAMFRAPEQAPGSGAPASPPPSSVVERGVDTAYRVLDEYLRQGRDAARRSTPPTQGAPFMNRDPGGLPLDVLRLWNNMMRSWFTLMGSPWMGGGAGGAAPSGGGWPGSPGGWAPGQPGGWPQGQPGGWPQGPTPPGPQPQPPEGLTAAGLAIVLQVETTPERPPRTVQVEVELHPGADVARLAVQDLSPLAGQDKRELKGIKIEPAGAHTARCLIRVPATQPPGTYAGVIYEQPTLAVRGNLRVLLREDGE